MNRFFPLLLALALPASAATVNYIWANTGTDMNSASSYRLPDGSVSTAVPTGDDRIFFVGCPTNQPHLSSTLEVRAICFGPIGNNGRTGVSKDDGMNGYSNSGWTITGESGASLVFPQSWTEGKNWNFAFSQATFGTNVVDVPVRFSGTGANLRPILPSGGALFFRKTVSCDEDGATIHVGGGNNCNARVVFEAANPDLRCGLFLEGNVSFVFTHPDAIRHVRSIRLDNQSYYAYLTYYEDPSTIDQTFENMSGEELFLPEVTEIFANTKQTSCTISGFPMRFSNAVMRTPYNDTKTYAFQTDVTVKRLENRNQNAGGYYFDKFGKGTLEVLEDCFTETPEGQTNSVRVMDGCLLLRDPSAFSRVPVFFGEQGYFFENGARPVLGLMTDVFYEEGAVPNGLLVWRDRGYVAGWAAYGADRHVTLFGDGIYKLQGGPNDVQAFGKTWAQRPRNLVFGARDADATVVFENGIDVNNSGSHWSNNARSIYSVKGGAFVDARIKGCITNTAASVASVRLHKAGDGVIAFDAPYHLSSGNEHFVQGGGLLINAWCNNKWIVQDGAWIGGTGTVAHLQIEAGGAIRGGEQGGVLTVGGSVTLKDGAGFIVDLGEAADGADSHGCVDFTGNRCAFKALGGVVVRPVLGANVKSGRTVKILDWSGVSNPTDDSLFNVGNWTVDADPDVFSKAELSVVGQAMYLKFALANTAPTAIFLLQ